MTKEEKYAKEILKIVKESGWHPAVLKSNGKPVNCTGFPCKDCLLKGCGSCNKAYRKWCEQEYVEFDWSKVPVDTPIWVWDGDGSKVIRHFAAYKNECVMAFPDGCTSLSLGEFDSLTPWEHGEPLTASEIENLEDRWKEKLL